VIKSRAVPCNKICAIHFFWSTVPKHWFLLLRFKKLEDGTVSKLCVPVHLNDWLRVPSKLARDKDSSVNNYRLRSFVAHDGPSPDFGHYYSGVVCSTVKETAFFILDDMNVSRSAVGLNFTLNEVHQRHVNIAIYNIVKCKNINFRPIFNIFSSTTDTKVDLRSRILSKIVSGSIDNELKAELSTILPVDCVSVQHHVSFIKKT